MNFAFYIIIRILLYIRELNKSLTYQTFLFKFTHLYPASVIFHDIFFEMFYKIIIGSHTKREVFCSHPASKIFLYIFWYALESRLRDVWHQIKKQRWFLFPLYPTPSHSPLHSCRWGHCWPVTPARWACLCPPLPAMPCPPCRTLCCCVSCRGTGRLETCCLSVCLWRTGDLCPSRWTWVWLHQEVQEMRPIPVVH